MTLHIQNPEAAQLAEELAALTGEPLDAAVTHALRQQILREQEIIEKLALIRDLQARVAALPVLDTRSAEEIIGYDENGLPT